MCQDTADRLNVLRRNPDNLSFLSVPQDQENEDDDFLSVPQDQKNENDDDRPIRQRSERLVTIFSNQSELDIYRFSTDQRLSVLGANILLGIVTKVCF
jgi:hypothetical protein